MGSHLISLLKVDREKFGRQRVGDKHHKPARVTKIVDRKFKNGDKKLPRNLILIRVWFIKKLWIKIKKDYKIGKDGEIYLYWSLLKPCLLHIAWINLKLWISRLGHPELDSNSRSAWDEWELTSQWIKDSCWFGWFCSSFSIQWSIQFFWDHDWEKVHGLWWHGIFGHINQCETWI